MDERTAHDALERYVRELHTAREHDDRPPSDEALRDLARELGYTDADLAAIDAEADRCLARGIGFLEYRRWDDAAQELKKVVGLRPNHAEAALGLAKAHAGRWSDRRQETDREEARRHAHRALHLDPAQREAIKLLNMLDQPALLRQRRRLGWGVAAGVLGLVVVGGALAFLTLASKPSGSTYEQPHRPEPLRAAQAVRAPVTDVPVTLAAEPAAEGLALEPRLSRLNTYSSKSYLTLATALRNDSRAEIKKLTATIVGTDASGEVLREHVTLLDSHQPALRPGDKVWYGRTFKASPTLSNVTIMELRAEAVPAPSTYDPGRNIIPRWQVPRPSHVLLQVRERANAVSSGFDDKVYARPSFAITNTGSGAIQTLKAELRFLDAQGKPLHASEQYVVSGEGQALRPGETVVEDWIAQVPKSYARYELRITAVE